MKIRFPHALVMTFLFHEGTLQEKLQFILSATYQHARNLALLTTLYKLLKQAMEYVRGGDSPLQEAAAGAVCGYLVFGADNKINMQVSLLSQYQFVRHLFHRSTSTCCLESLLH